MDQRTSHLGRQSDETDLPPVANTEMEAVASEPGSPPARARPWRLYGVILAALIVLGVGGWWLYQQFTHVFVTDARVAADIVAVSSRVPGWVTAVEVIAGDSVRKGDILVRIDDRESRLLVQELDAQIAGIARRREEIKARIKLIGRQTTSRIAAKQAAAEAALAAVAA